MSFASGIKISQRLGRNEPESARQAGYTGILMSCSLLVVTLSVELLLRNELLGIVFFNKERAFFEMLGDAWIPFALTFVFMNFAVSIENILFSMGRAKEVFGMKLVALWGYQVPAVMVFVRYFRHGLVGLFCGLAVGYGVLACLYGYAFMSR